MKRFVEWESPTYKTGQRFHKLTILKTLKLAGTYRYYALCQCNCGSKPKHIRIDGMECGHAISCGCAHREAITTHGLWGTPFLNIHRGMMSRCYNRADKRFAHYGGRGITVCKRWHDILRFVEDMSPAYRPRLTLERVDNDKGYAPENCRWATIREQNRNYRRNLMFTHGGKTLCLQEWAELAALPYKLLWERIRALGWSFERAISTPPMTTPQTR